MDKLSAPFRWNAPAALTENHAYEQVRKLSDALHQPPPKVIVNFSSTNWADPLCLLQTALLLKYANLAGTEVSVDLGEIRKSSDHDAFLKFFWSQGFFEGFAKFSKITAIANRRKISESVEAQLAALEIQPRLGLHKCIPFEIVNASEFADNPKALQQYIEIIVQRADHLSIKSAFGSSPSARDMLFQKLRKSLFELLLNVSEHAYPNNPRLGAVFARVRLGRPPDTKGAASWRELLSATQAIHGNTKFFPNHFTEWVELYVCDVGIGLLSNIKKWNAGGEPDIEAAIRRAAASAFPLEVIAPVLFNAPLSSHVRHVTNRTSVTGLQHLGKILSIGGDYARIYTELGAWIGNSFPWGDDSTYSRTTISDSRTKKGLPLKNGPPGTSYHISIQPRHDSKLKHNHPEEEPTPETLSEIRAALRGQANAFVSRQPKTITAIDRRIAKSGFIPEAETLLSSNGGLVVLRPPRLMSKNDLGKWLKAVIGNRRDAPTAPVDGLILVELSHFHFLALADLLIDLQTHESASAGIWLVSDSWSVISMQAANGRVVHQQRNNQKSKKFLDCLSLGDIALILREMDSELFWYDKSDKPRQALMNIRVDWTDSRPRPTTINRYLDFPQSLTEPTAFRAARRALRRVLALYPNARIRPADDLAEAILATISLPSLQPEHEDVDADRALVVVGSVAVSGDTVTSVSPKSTTELVNVLHHEDAAVSVHEQATSALLWITDLGDSRKLELAPPPDDAPHWSRIPGTSFITPAGAHALSVLRYRRSKDGTLDFESPLYPRRPEDTYEDFRRYKAIRLGHWKYGPRHDLLTINMRTVFAHAFLELGPLYDWLRKTFDDLFRFSTDGKVGAHLLVYPSHPVTDYLFDRLRQDTGFAKNMPMLGVVPIKFAGERTVSPLVAFQPIRETIEARAKKKRLTAWSAAVMDDGVISGKHMREISQLLTAMGAKSVRTVAVVDRSGLPSQETLVAPYLERNRRYWRWDVPALGNHRNCILCHALGILHLQAATATPRVRRRMSEWDSIWRARDSNREWYVGTDFRVEFQPKLKITFGVDDRRPGREGRKEIEISDSVELVSVTVELARLTGNFGIAFKKAKEIESLYLEVALQLVCSQYLIFVDELLESEKYQRLDFILTRLWICDATNESSALAGLTLCCCDSLTASVLTKSTIARLIAKSELGTIDAVIALRGLIRAGGAEEWLLKNADSSNQVTQRNLLRLGLQNDALGAVRAFISVAHSETEKSGAWLHSSRLREALSKTITSTSPSEIGAESIHRISRLLDDAESAISRIAEERLVDIATSDLERLRGQAIKLRAQCSKRDPSTLSGLVRSVYSTLFGDGASANGLMTSVAGQLFVPVNQAEDAYRRIIRPQQERICNDWERYVRSRAADENRGRPERRRWLLDTDDLSPPPVWSEASTVIEGHCLVYFDSLTQDALRDAMLNVFHSSRSAELSLVDQEAGAIQLTADQWWSAIVEDGFVVIRLTNVCANKVRGLNDSAPIAGLERVGGSVVLESTQINDSEHLAITIVRIPLFATFVRRSV